MLAIDTIIAKMEIKLFFFNGNPPNIILTFKYILYLIKFQYYIKI